jgi:cytochrome c biogenesis protein CcdA
MPTQGMDIDQINRRVDLALIDNRRAEVIIIGMALGIFLAGLGTLLVAYWQQNPYIAGGGIVLNGLLYWPVREIKKLRRDNLVLQVLPTIIAGLPPAEAIKEIKKLAAHIRGKE